MLKLLEALCSVPSVSGREHAIRNTLCDMISPLCDEVGTDALGNLIAVRRGTADDRKKVMLCAHMDEIGYLVTFLEEDGSLRLSGVGGIHWAACAYGSVISERGVRGVLVPEDGVKPADYAADKFIIDIGTSSREESESLVSVGDFFVSTPTLTPLYGRRIAGRPLDDRAGCAVLLSIAEHFTKQPPKNDLYYVFSVQEEVGCRGAKPASFAIAPDYALVFDVTGTGDVKGAKPMACRVDGGAAIKIKDASVICHTEVVETLGRLAKENGISHQAEILPYGGTDTSSIQMSGFGCRVGALSIPTRYIHSGTELLSLSDAEACVSLAVAFCDRI